MAVCLPTSGTVAVRYDILRREFLEATTHYCLLSHGNYASVGASLRRGKVERGYEQQTLRDTVSCLFVTFRVYLLIFVAC